MWTKRKWWLSSNRRGARRKAPAADMIVLDANILVRATRGGGCLNRNVRSAQNGRGRMDLVCCRWPSISHKGDPQMKVWMAVAGVLLVPACSYAQGPKACDELKTE